MATDTTLAAALLDDPTQVTNALAGQPVAPSSVTTPTISGAANLLTITSPILAQQYLVVQGDQQVGGTLRIGANDTGLSRVAPATLAVGNGTPNDASGTVQAANFIASSLISNPGVVLRNDPALPLGFLDGSNGTRILFGAPATGDLRLYRDYAGNYANLSLGSLNVSGTAQATNFTLNGGAIYSYTGIELVPASGFGVNVTGNLTASGTVAAKATDSTPAFAASSTADGQVFFQATDGYGTVKIQYGTVSAPQVYASGGVTAGSNVIASGTIKPGSFTVATLPTPSTAGAGATAYVIDSTLPYTGPNVGAAVAGGGGNYVPVTCNGFGWYIG